MVLTKRQKDRQCNGLNKNGKRTDNVMVLTKLEIEPLKPHLRSGTNSGAVQITSCETTIEVSEDSIDIK